MKKKAVAYIRVSTASDAQIHSYDFQEDYWRNKIEQMPDTELQTIYAERGISGYSTKKREQFLSMMQDAREHKFDVIYTKSVSRFSRNVIDLLDAIRELRDIGIEVIFEKENIHTFEPTSEIFLTIAATIAENDLQVDSERQRWSIKHRIENGWISIGSGLLGYKMNEDNTLEIVPEEAEIIKEMYNRYINGEGTKKIATWLNESGIKTRLGNPWSSKAVMGTLENEKYKGDCIMLKSIKRMGKSLNNSNSKYCSQYFTEDSHEGIVSKEIWQQAQEIRMKRAEKFKSDKQNMIYPFTSLIECQKCGKHYIHKVNNCGKKWQTDIWTCKTKAQTGINGCNNKNIKNSVLEEKFIECYNEFIRTRPQGKTVVELQNMLSKLRQDESDLAKLHMQHLIADDSYTTEREKIKVKAREIMQRISKQNRSNIKPNEYIEIESFDAEKVKKFITKVTIQDDVVTFVFYNDVKISRKYTNGQSGNKPGWNKKED